MTSLGIAKIFITPDRKEAEEYYNRWVDEYGSYVTTLWRRGAVYEARVMPYMIATKGDADFIVEFRNET